MAGRSDGRKTRRANGTPLTKEWFMTLVKKEGCWIWQRSLDRHGYGYLEGTSAHRAAYKLFIGSIPDGMDVLHTCDNPPCVNPKHLFLGTQADNLEDMRKKERHVHGESHPGAHLTEKDIRAIRSDQRLQREIAEDYEIAQGHVSAIRSYKFWRHVK